MGKGIIGGKLRLKGIDSKKKKKKKKTKENDERDTAVRGGTSATAESGQTLPISAPGSGQILTSGTSVMGKGTKLQEELHVGDTITVLNESTLVEETRRIVMVLGPTAAALSAPFTSDIVTHSDFTITSMPSGYTKSSAGKRVKSDGSRELVWREKTGFSYRYRREKIKKTGAMDLLDMRCKKKADRLCM